MRGEDRAESLAEYSAAPRLELDQLLTQLIDHAQDVMAARDRLRGLLRANRLIIGELTLPVVLRRIAEAARDLVQARYAALGVLGPDGAWSSSSTSAWTRRWLPGSGTYPRARACSAR